MSGLRRACFLLGLGTLLLGQAACVEPIVLQGVTTPDAGSPDAGPGIVDIPTPPQLALLLTIDSPTEGAQIEDPRVTVGGRTSWETIAGADDSPSDPVGWPAAVPAVVGVTVRSGPNLPLAATSADGFQTWTVDVPVGVGLVTLEATAWAADGTPLGEPEQVQIVGPSVAGDLAPPLVAIQTPLDGEQLTRADVWLAGTTADDRGVVRMWVEVDGVERPERPVWTDDQFATWYWTGPLSGGTDAQLTVFAEDGVGQLGRASVTVRGRTRNDRTPPTLRIDAPRDGASVVGDTVAVRGQALDDQAVRDVRVRVLTTPGAVDPLAPPQDERPGEETQRIGAWVDAQSTDGFASFVAQVPVPAGDVVLEVRATDTAGLAAVERVAVQVDQTQAWTAERTYFLRLRDQRPPPFRVVLDRDGLEQILDEDTQREILLLELDPSALLRNTLDRIKVACGTAWQQDRADPRHDCSLTPLGRTFRGPDGTWRSSAEYAMVRLLTMTPANVTVVGTSIEGLQELADGSFFGIRIGGGFNQILSDSLGIARTEEIVSTEFGMQALRQGVLASHPATTEDGALPVTLYDALRSLQPMATTLGPVDGHPGILDPASPPVSEIFGPDLQITLSGTSNLRRYDGLALARGKDYLTVIDDRTGPGTNDVVEFDFLDATAFDVDGLIEAPVVDLRFVVFEAPTFVPSCNGEDRCQSNLPDSPLSAASIWALPPHTIEWVLARTAYLQYQARRHRRCYIEFLGCQADVRIGQDSNPAGWTQFRILLNLGNPPRNQYVWELLAEIAQVALHRIGSTTLPEGEANVAFSLTELPVGITASELREAMRPYLQAQSGALSERVLGAWDRNNARVEFTLQPAPDGTPQLVFVHPDDPLPPPAPGESAYPWRRPGFFAATGLAADTRVDRVDGNGRRVWPVPIGRSTVYLADAADVEYRVIVERRAETPNEVVARVARRLL